MKRWWMVLVSGILLTLAASAGWACVGKTLQVGVITRGEDRLLTRLLTVLVNERTGTSIRIREYANFRGCFNALQKNEIDMVIASAGQGFSEVLTRGRTETATQVLAEARQVFNERYNLVWLEPWGLLDSGSFLKDAAGQPLPTQVAPLVRKETLKEFPALARLINKMAGRLDEGKLAGLMRKSGADDADRTAREYLKSEKLI